MEDAYREALESSRAQMAAAAGHDGLGAAGVGGGLEDEADALGARYNEEWARAAAALESLNLDAQRGGAFADDQGRYGAQGGGSGGAPYEFLTENPFLDPSHALFANASGAAADAGPRESSASRSRACFEEGVRLFEAGEIGGAVQAFEATLQALQSLGGGQVAGAGQVANADAGLEAEAADAAEAWRMLGQSHAEHDEDRRAIACLERAVEEDPYNLEALLALGVSYVNEVRLSSSSSSFFFFFFLFSFSNLSFYHFCLLFLFVSLFVPLDSKLT